MKRRTIPDIPFENVAGTRLKLRKVWALEDLNLDDPAIYIDCCGKYEHQLTNLAEMMLPG